MSKSRIDNVAEMGTFVNVSFTNAMRAGEVNASVRIPYGTPSAPSA
jgi:hypothetical protein